MGLVERVADPKDPLRIDLRTAREWRIPPTVFLGDRTVGPPWTDQDTAYARALAVYEASLCPGCAHDLDETTDPRNQDRYTWGKPTRCFRCQARGYAHSSIDSDEKHPDSLLFTISLPE